LGARWQDPTVGLSDAAPAGYRSRPGTRALPELVQARTRLYKTPKQKDEHTVNRAMPSPEPAVGPRIREIRRRGNVTLRELADAAGVSESFVSQVERGVANPSMASLSRIADALGTNLAALFVGAEQTGSVVRSGERKRMAHPAGSQEDYLITPSSAKTMQIIYSVIAVGQGSGDEPYAHAADEECVVVLAGKLDVTVNGENHHLATGDALMLDPRSPHTYLNPGPDTTTALWVTSPPVY
jgi:transcriptional regulator with XRE-family HTH domain